MEDDGLSIHRNIGTRGDEVLFVITVSSVVETEVCSEPLKCSSRVEERDSISKSG